MTKNGTLPAKTHSGVHDEFPLPIIVRLDEVPATARNTARIRERVRLLNQRLAASGTPFQLRVV